MVNNSSNNIGCGMKKRYTVILFIVSVLLLNSLSLQANAASVLKGYFNGKVIEMKNPPIIENNMGYFPFGEIYSAMGYKVSWLQKEKLLTAKNENIGRCSVIQYKTTDLKSVWIEGYRVNLAIPNKVKNGILYLPLKNFKELFGYDIHWDVKKGLVSMALPPEYVWLRNPYGWEDKNGNIVDLPHLGKAILIEAKVDSESVLGYYKIRIKYNNQEYIQNYVSEYDLQNQFYTFNPFTTYSYWPKKYWDAIKQEEIMLGMSPEMVVVAWGRPYDINESTGSWGTHEQWIYGSDISNRNYLYFENGILTSWQD